MKTKMKMVKRKKTKGDELVKRNSDPFILKIVKYFVDRKNQDFYATGKWLMAIQLYRKDGITRVHMTNYHGFHRDAGKALRFLLYGFILFDINDTIICDMDFEPTLVNIFDDPVPESVSNLKEFGWYIGWKPVWIHILLNMARESNDIDMFQKILNRIPNGVHDDKLQGILNATSDFEYKALIMRKLSESGQTELLL